MKRKELPNLPPCLTQSSRVRFIVRDRGYRFYYNSSVGETVSVIVYPTFHEAWWAYRKYSAAAHVGKADTTLVSCVPSRKPKEPKPAPPPKKLPVAKPIARPLTPEEKRTCPAWWEKETPSRYCACAWCREGVAPIQESA